MRRMGPYLRSHHPSCTPFRADVIIANGKRYCIACFVGYPFLAAAFLPAVLLLDEWPGPWWAWAVAGLAVALPQALSFAGRVPSWRVQVAVKAALGTGFGLFMAAVLHAPWPLWARLLGLVLAMIGLNALWLLRFHRLERTCQSCPQVGLRPRCEGLRDLDDRVGAIVRLPQPSWVPVPTPESPAVPPRRP